MAAANEFAWGASEALWTSAVPHLLHRGARVTANVKQWQPESPVLAQLEAFGCTIIRRPDTAAERGRPKCDLPVIERTTQTLASANPDLVLVNQGDNIEGLGWMEACQELDLPYVVLSHSVSEQSWPPDALAERQRRGFLGAKRSLFVSVHNRRLTERQVMGPLPNGDLVPLTFKVPYHNELPWPDADVVRVAVVARLDPDSKGQDVLFEVLAWPRWRNRRVAVDLYGTGHCGAVLRALRNHLRLDMVHFRGQVDDVTGIWRDHQLLVLPSRVEGLPTVVIEAMLCGRVVVAADAGGVRELVDDEETGFVAPAATPDCLADALERAWRRRAEWPEIGAQARKAIRERVTPDGAESFADRLIALTWG